MIVAVFSSFNDIHNFFAELDASMEHSIYYLSWEDYEEQIRKMPSETLFYIDIRNFKKDKISELIDCFSLLDEKNYGIIDPDAIINDIGRLFHNGAVDYVSKNVFESGFTPIRFENRQQIHSGKGD